MKEKDSDHNGAAAHDNDDLCATKNGAKPDGRTNGNVQSGAACGATAGIETGEDEKSDVGTADSNAAEVPPPYREGDAERDIALLRAIASHPKAAQFLAELAGGGEEATLVRKYFPREPAMYQAPSDMTENAASLPAFLRLRRRGFWD